MAQSETPDLPAFMRRSALHHTRTDSGVQLLLPEWKCSFSSSEEDHDDSSPAAPCKQESAFYKRRNPMRRPTLTKFLDRLLVGNSDSGNYSQKWREDFAKHPTWCDADMCLQQMNRGMAKGNRIALYARTFFQRILFILGNFIQGNPYKTLLVGLSFFLICSIGLKDAVIETDIVKLWVSQDGRLNDELTFADRVRSNVLEGSSRGKREAPFSEFERTMNEIHMITKRAPEIPRSAGLGGGFQVVIQTPEMKGQNILTTEGLLKHVEIMKEIAQYKVEMHGENWTLSDICFKPPSPKFGEGPLAGIMSTLLDKIIPCIWITPIDCFWEGSKPLGPYPPLNLGADISGLISSLPKGNITWKNLNPTDVVKDVGVLFDLGTIDDFFSRAGIGAAYLDRYCIDPLDPECPRIAPNGFDKCGTYRKFRAWNMGRSPSEQVHLDAEHPPPIDPKADAEAGSFIVDLLGRRKKRQAALLGTTNGTKKQQSKDEDYYSYEDDKEYPITGMNTTKMPDPIEAECEIYGNSMLRWMRTYPERWGEFLTQEEMPKYPNYGEIMTGGCKGFAKNIMKWPEDLIIGGVGRQNQRVVTAEAFQSVFLVAGSSDVYYRFQGGKPDIKPNLNAKTWSISKANEIVSAWQRNFTKRLYDHPWNQRQTRVVHPLAGTSISDMLEEFSQFKFFVIIMGYFLMVLYAGWSQLEWDGWWFAATSTCGLSFIGVFLVTYSSIAGLGLSTFFGINFNAATTQIVPFLTLGLGVDDMFLFLHTYGEVLHVTKDYELGVLMKETGMSILITSINNILAFVSGTVLPIPALRSFCSQSAILLAFNLFGIMLIYPAFIALDLKRRKTGVRDMMCCFPTCGDEDANEKKLKQAQEESLRESGIVKGGIRSTGLSSIDYPGPPPPVDFGAPEPEEELRWYTLDGFANMYYIPFLQMPSTKVLVLLFCSALFLFGCYGLHGSTLGLELSDVLPEGTAPSAFLKAREQYFSFYPMSAVLKGLDVDYPKQQMKIEEYRQAIAKSQFVVKVDNKPSEHYWLSLMRLWLKSLQTHLDEAITHGLINNVTGEIKKGSKLKDEAGIARRLLCSYGNNYNCSARIGLRLIDDSGMINQEGFYNYLTGWYNVDNMMYYVSQAALYPSPHGWAYSKEEKLVPPSPELAYSQIPFYLTDLVNTPVIVDMIREIRATCERFEEEGLPNYPYGIAFTFWEQYLHLTWNLFVAICIIAGSVFLVVSCIIFNPWAAAMIMVVVVSMTIELAGFMGLFGVKLNPVSAVTLITAVGIGVEFTAHVVLAFLTALGTRDERMASCMNHMFTPVVHGGLSTLLGIVMLAFSEFEFVITYFFLVMSVLILLGLINGLALLPVLLSLIGPPCELKPVNGGDTLQTPPPLNKEKSDQNKTESEIALVSGTMISIRRPAGIENNSSSNSLDDSSESCNELPQNSN